MLKRSETEMRVKYVSELFEKEPGLSVRQAQARIVAVHGKQMRFRNILKIRNEVKGTK